MALIAHITDLHLRPPGTLTLGHVDCERFLSAAIARLCAKYPQIDAVMVTGDLADLGEEGAYQRAVTLLSSFKVPVFVVPGNHDRTGALRRAFSSWPGVRDTCLPQKVCYRAEAADATLILLDTSVDGLDRGEHFGTLGDEQLAWLDSALAGAGPTIIGMHHPPFRSTIGFMDTVDLRDAAAFAAVIARHSNVKRIVCGHVHRTIVGEVGGVPAMALPGVAHQVELALSPSSPAELVMEPPAFGLHLVSEQEAISHVAYVNDYGAPLRFSELKERAEPAQ
ncbi:MAG: phosphodiesterase [Pseudomonadota bacterium]